MQLIKKMSFAHDNIDDFGLLPYVNNYVHFTVNYNNSSMGAGHNKKYKGILRVKNGKFYLQDFVEKDYYFYYTFTAVFGAMSMPKNSFQKPSLYTYVTKDYPLQKIFDHLSLFSFPWQDDHFRFNNGRFPDYYKRTNNTFSPTSVDSMLSAFNIYCNNYMEEEDKFLFLYGENDAIQTEYNENYCVKNTLLRSIDIEIYKYEPSLLTLAQMINIQIKDSLKQLHNFEKYSRSFGFAKKNERVLYLSFLRKNDCYSKISIKNANKVNKSELNFDIILPYMYAKKSDFPTVALPISKGLIKTFGYMYEMDQPIFIDMVVDYKTSALVYTCGKFMCHYINMNPSYCVYGNEQKN